MKRILSTAFCLLLCACAAQPQRMGDTAPLAAEGSASAGQATVYVLRDNSMQGGVWNIDIKVDGVSRGSVRAETYIAFNVLPGTHVLAAEWPMLTGLPNIAGEAGFAADKTYYFMVSPGVDSAGTGNGMQYSIGLGQIAQPLAQFRMSTYARRQEKAVAN